MKRVARVYDHALAIVDNLVAERRKGIADDARAFADVAFMEQRPFSRASGGTDLRELLKHARDGDDQSSFRVAVLFEKLLGDLMLTAVRSVDWYRDGLVEANCEWVRGDDVYPRHESFERKRSTPRRCFNRTTHPRPPARSMRGRRSCRPKY